MDEKTVGALATWISAYLLIKTFKWGRGCGGQSTIKQNFQVLTKPRVHLDSGVPVFMLPPAGGFLGSWNSQLQAPNEGAAGLLFLMMFPRLLGEASVSEPITGYILLPPENERRPDLLLDATCGPAQFRGSGGVGVGNRETQTWYPVGGVAGRRESPPLPVMTPPPSSSV